MENNGKIRCAAYIRVSTDEQVATGSSLDGQKDLIVKAISLKENHIIDEKRHIYIDDGESGASDNRPKFNKMMKDAENGEFDILFVYAIDRLYRKTLGLLETVEKLDKYNVKFKSITQDIDTSSSFGKTILQIMGAIAELERNLIRERTIMGKLSKVKKGYFVGGGGPSLGYDFNNDGIGVKATINEKEATLVKKIFNLFVKEGKTLGEIKKILETSGEKTKYDILYSGKETNIKNTNGTWHTTTISSILQNEMYFGKYHYGKTEKKNGKVINKPKETWLSFDCPIIIEDKSLFFKAKELLEKNKVTKNNDNSHTFAGLIKCNECGKSYVGSISKRESNRYVNYKCKGTIKNNYIEDNRCINTGISELYLVGKCWQKIEEVFRDPKKLLEEYYNESKKNNILEEYYKELDECNDGIKKTNTTIQNIYEDLYSGNDNDRKNKEAVLERLKLKLDGFFGLKIEIEENINKLESIERNKSNLFDLVKLYRNKIDNLSDEKKIELIKLFVDKIIIFKGGKLKIYFKFEPTDNSDENQDLKKKVNKSNAVVCSTI